MNEIIKTSEQRYNEKMKRITDAIELKIPDRVPIITLTETFCGHYAGETVEDMLRKYDVAERAYDKFFTDFDADFAFNPVFLFPVIVFETLGLQWMRWPGNGLGPNSLYQYIEDGYMLQEEYDEFLFDPTRFMLTKWIPRSFKNLEGLSTLTGLSNSCWLGFFNAFVPCSAPNVKESLNALMKSADELAAWYEFLTNYTIKMKEQFGVPNAWGGFAFAPFDMIGDSMRGTIGSLIDTKEVPDKVIAACEKFVPIAIESAVNSAAATGNKFIWIWLHKGIDEFMSNEDFNKFYWPTLKKVLDGLIENGLTPVVYGEGSLNNRLETLRELPVGKVIMHFEKQDMKRAKDVLKDICCISGNVPADMLHWGTPDEVKEYCKKLIEDCGKGGGFIMDTACVIDDANPKNVKAMFDAVNEFGVY